GEDTADDELDAVGSHDAGSRVDDDDLTDRPQRERVRLVHERSPGPRVPRPCRRRCATSGPFSTSSLTRPQITSISGAPTAIPVGRATTRSQSSSVLTNRPILAAPDR